MCRVGPRREDAECRQMLQAACGGCAVKEVRGCRGEYPILRIRDSAMDAPVLR